MQRIVITGGPSTGKTSIIQSLENDGQFVFHEIARKIIKEQMDLKSEKVPWLNVSAFSKLVLQEQIQDFQKGAAPLNFYDRGIPDIIGYLNYNQQPRIPELESAVAEYQYDHIFITPPWQEIYQTDNERRESFEESIRIFEELKLAYTTLGYTPIIIPNTSVANRVQFIQQKIHG